MKEDLSSYCLAQVKTMMPNVVGKIYVATRQQQEQQAKTKVRGGNLFLQYWRLWVQIPSGVKLCAPFVLLYKKNNNCSTLLAPDTWIIVASLDSVASEAY